MFTILYLRGGPSWSSTDSIYIVHPPPCRISQHFPVFCEARSGAQRVRATLTWPLNERCHEQISCLELNQHMKPSQQVGSLGGNPPFSLATIAWVHCLHRVSQSIKTSSNKMSHLQFFFGTSVLFAMAQHQVCDHVTVENERDWIVTFCTTAESFIPLSLLKW